MTSTKCYQKAKEWHDANKFLPPALKQVVVKGYDCMGGWTISGVWWQPYKGKKHFNGRWMKYTIGCNTDRLPESDDVEMWRDL